MSYQELQNSLLKIFKTLSPLKKLILDFGKRNDILSRRQPGQYTLMFFSLTKHTTLICMKQKFHFISNFTAGQKEGCPMEGSPMKFWNIFSHSYLIIQSLNIKVKLYLLCLLTVILKEVTHRKQLLSSTYSILTIWLLVSSPNCSNMIHRIETQCLCICPCLFLSQHIFQ